MLAYSLELIKAVIPSKIANTCLPTSNEYNNETMESQLPLTPFCCVSAIPSSFRYLVALLPASTSHNVLAKPLTSTPLVTAFLMYVTNCYHNPHELRPKEIIRPSASNFYYAIVQLITIKSAGQPSSTASIPTSGKLPRLAHPPRQGSAASISRFEPVEQGFTDIGLGLGSSSKAPQLPPRRGSAASTSRFTPIDETFTDILLTYQSSQSSQPQNKAARYFTPIENSRESTILNPDQNLKGKMWKEIEERDAMESLRFLGTGTNIGDGENWRELEGMETVVCRAHGLEFEMRAWVKEL